MLGSLFDVVKSVTSPVTDVVKSVTSPVTDILSDLEDETCEIVDAVATPFVIGHNTAKTVVDDLVDALKNGVKDK